MLPERERERFLYVLTCVGAHVLLVVRLLFIHGINLTPLERIVDIRFFDFVTPLSFVS